MSNNALGCSSRWVANCELRGVWCGVGITEACIRAGFNMRLYRCACCGGDEHGCGAVEGGPVRCDSASVLNGAVWLSVLLRYGVLPEVLICVLMWVEPRTIAILRAIKLNKNQLDAHLPPICNSRCITKPSCIQHSPHATQHQRTHHKLVSQKFSN
jgi:hypothetical protein